MNRMVFPLVFAAFSCAEAELFEIEVQVPNPGYSAEILSIYQSGDETFALYTLVPPEEGLAFAQVVSTSTATAEVDAPALSLQGAFDAAVVTIPSDTRFLFNQGEGQVVSYDYDEGDDGWVDSAELGWVFLHPSGWNYSLELGAWIYPGDVVHEDDLFLSDPGPRRLWFYGRGESLAGDWYYSGRGLAVAGGRRWVYSFTLGEWIVVGG